MSSLMLLPLPVAKIPSSIKEGNKIPPHANNMWKMNCPLTIMVMSAKKEPRGIKITA